jgi:hypothetical protein
MRKIERKYFRYTSCEKVDQRHEISNGNEPVRENIPGREPKKSIPARIVRPLVFSHIGARTLQTSTRRRRVLCENISFEIRTTSTAPGRGGK